MLPESDLKATMHIDFGWGSAPDPLGSLQRSPGSLAGFKKPTYKGRPCSEKMWGPSPRKKLATFFSHDRPSACQLSVLLKNWRPFFAHYSRCSLGGCPLFQYFGHAKNSSLLLWGPLFVGPLFGRTC